MRGDVLTAQMIKPENQPSKISKVNAQGHVILISEDQIARGIRIGCRADHFQVRLGRQRVSQHVPDQG